MQSSSSQSSSAAEASPLSPSPSPSPSPLSSSASAPSASASELSSSSLPSSASPLSSGGWYSRLTWSFVDRVIDIGVRRVLRASDLDVLGRVDQARYNKDLLWRAWTRQCAIVSPPADTAKRDSQNVDDNNDNNSKEQHDDGDNDDDDDDDDDDEEEEEEEEKESRHGWMLWGALWHGYGHRFLIIGMMLVLYSGLKIGQAAVLGRIVRFVQDTTEDTYIGYIWALLLFVLAMGQAFIHHQYFFGVMRVGADVRVALTGLVYQKALGLKSSSFVNTTTGQVVNLISNDTHKLEQGAIFANYIWAAPLEASVCLWLLWLELGVSSLIGFGVVLCMIPLQSSFANQFGRLRTQTLKYTDRRIKTVNEILTGAEVMKLYSWEEPMEARVQHSRDKEFKYIRKASVLRAINQGISFSASALIGLTTFVPYVALGNTLTSEKVFTSVALFNIMRLSLTLFFTLSIEFLSMSHVSVKRLEAFLLLPELKAESEGDGDKKEHGEPRRMDDDGIDDEEAKSAGEERGSVLMSCASYRWDVPGSQAEAESRFSRTGVASERASSDAAVAPEDVGSARFGLNAGTHDKEMEERAETQLEVDAEFAPEHAHTEPQSVGNESVSRVSGMLHAVGSDAGSVSSAHVLLSVGESQDEREDDLDRATRLTLSDISLRIRPGEFWGIVGPVGSSKSSLMAAILGEMEMISGQASATGAVSFAPQKPWIMAATLRENIVFGHVFDADRYANVVAACQLKADLEMLQAGDMTLIGERGVNLSGGQRARVSLARAVYSRADLYMFDDPLSAVDTVVARRIFKFCFSNEHGLLRDKTRILVTHQTYFLPEISHVAVLRLGKLTAVGRYDRLVADGVDMGIQDDDNGTSSDAGSDAIEDKQVESEQAATDVAVDESAHEAKSGAHEAIQHEQDEHGIIVTEKSQIGVVTWDVYLAFLSSSGNILVVFMMALLMGLGQAMVIVADWWLARWSVESAADQQGSSYELVYVALVVFAILGSLVRAQWAFYVILNAAYELHQKMFKGVLYASMRFFESNPVGRILNRFSKDQNVVDEFLPVTMYDLMQAVFMVLGSVVVIVAVEPMTLFALVPLVPLFLRVRRHYLMSSREIKRFDATSRSPIYAHFSATLSGLVTVRAFGSQRRFMQMFLDKTDANMRWWMAFLTSSRWLGFRLDCISSLMILTAGMAAVITRESADPGHVGLALTYSLVLTALLQWAVRQSAEVESMMTATERIIQYAQIVPEGKRVIDDCRPPKNWPHKGVIQAKGLQVRYRPELDLVLRGVNLTIDQPTTGVCGRTGSGKSTLFASIFRLVEPTGGTITIDGIDIQSIGLHDLRSRLSIIPQSPMLFSGDVRSNLDPFSQYSDKQVWGALEAVDLRKMVEAQPDRLHTRMGEMGSNFSVGEAQLLCVARAILKPSKLLFVDEATASVDARTDQLIQNVLREQFADRTVVTIAHRLSSITDSKRIIVMDRGVVVQFGSPRELLADKNGIFASLAQIKHM